MAGIQTPAIDSVTWAQPNDLNVYLYTHDPLNNTRYYKWTYAETWQYNSALETVYGVANNLIFVSDVTNQTDSCWKSDLSTDVLIGSSLALSHDVINNQNCDHPRNDERLAVRYSMLVTQIGISAGAYEYWQIVEKTRRTVVDCSTCNPVN